MTQKARGPVPRQRLNLRQAAAVLAVSVDTIRRRIADGSLPAERVGQQLRVYLDDVEALAVPVPSVQRD